MNYFRGQIFDITSPFSDLSKALRRICPGLGHASLRRGLFRQHPLSPVSKAFVFMMNFLSVRHNVPNEPRVNNSMKKTKKSPRHTKTPPITNKETILVIERESDIVSAHFSRTINQKRKCWGTKRTTNYLPVSLWGLSQCFMPLKVCKVSHIS